MWIKSEYSRSENLSKHRCVFFAFSYSIAAVTVAATYTEYWFKSREVAQVLKVIKITALTTCFKLF
jgi:hypothetical protein